MTDDEIRELWVYCHNTWPTFTVSTRAESRDITLRVWRDHLGDFDQREVAAAFVALDRSEHRPPFGVIRDTVGALRERRLGGHGTPDVDEAWREVRQQVGMTGRLGSPLWSHPAIEATVAAMGWIDLCNATEPGVVRAQFAKLYATAAARLTRERVALAPALQEFLQERPGLKRAEDQEALQ